MKYLKQMLVVSLLASGLSLRAMDTQAADFPKQLMQAYQDLEAALQREDDCTFEELCGPSADKDRRLALRNALSKKQAEIEKKLEQIENEMDQYEARLAEIADIENQRALAAANGTQVDY